MNSQQEPTMSSTVLETRYWWAIVPYLGAFQLSVLEINSREGTKDIPRSSQFFVQLCTETYASVQLWWHFWPTLRMNFVTQFSAVDPFKIEHNEETKKSFHEMQFWPYSHALNFERIYGWKPCAKAKKKPLKIAHQVSKLASSPN